MSINNTIYLSKLDLDTYSYDDLQILAEFYNIKETDKSNLCWLLAIHIINTQKAHMIEDNKILKKSNKGGLMKNIFKPQQTIRRGIANIADLYNTNDNKCEWPTTSNMSIKTIEKCNIPMIPLKTIYYENKKIEIVKIPSGTKLFHGTKSPNFLPLNENDWIKGPQKMFWFATTFNHTRPHEPIKVLEITLKEDINLLFIRNISKELNISSGYEFYPLLLNILNKVQEENTNLIIDGYTGCNECEVGLLKKSLNKISYPIKETKVNWI